MILDNFYLLLFNFTQKENALGQVPDRCLGAPEKITINNDGWKLRLNDCQQKLIGNMHLEFSLPNFMEVEIKDIQNKIMIKKKKSEDMLFHLKKINDNLKEEIVIYSIKIRKMLLKEN